MQRIRPCNQADGRRRLNITVKQESSQENGSEPLAEQN